MTTLIATFPKIHPEHFQVFVTCTSTLPLSMQPRQPCFSKFSFFYSIKKFDIYCYLLNYSIAFNLALLYQIYSDCFKGNPDF